MDPSRFVSPVAPEFLCPICSEVLTNPVETPCEHYFCSQHIHQWLMNHDTCPVDRVKLAVSDLRTPPRVFRTLLEQLQLYCENKQNGCNEIVTLDRVAAHSDICPKALVPCEFGCAGEKVMREKLAEHYTASTQLHLLYMARKITTLEGKLKAKEAEMERLFGASSDAHISNCDILCEFTDWRRLKDATRRTLSKVETRFTAGKYNFALQLYPNGDTPSEKPYIGVYLCRLPGQFDTCLPAFSSPFSITLLDQSLWTRSVSRTLIDCPGLDVNKTWGRRQFLPLVDLEDSKRSFVVNDTILFRVSFQSRASPMTDMH